MLLRAVLLLLLVLLLTDSVFISRRRRAPQPPKVDCSLTSWKTVGTCSETCGANGREKQERTIVEEGRNGGKPCSDYDLERTIACNRICYNHGTIDDTANQCQCQAGWQGDCCNEDVDECIPGHPCEQLCVNDEGSFHCECLSNYTLATDNKSCKDVKECQKDPPPCDHRCEEKDGGYECYCNKGYKLATDSRSCQDIDECTTGSQCQYRCNNIPGDYECICSSGYFRNSDNKTCTDINECNTNNGGCAQSCDNTQGGFRCNCTSGYTLAGNFYDCQDINECEVYGEYNICEQRCNNILGSYTCSCIPPYLLNTDQRTCYSSTSDNHDDNDDDNDDDDGFNSTSVDCSNGASTDSELCKAIKEQAEANKKVVAGGNNDAVYNWIIVVLICICVSLVIGLVFVCGRKGYHRMYPPKLPPLSTMPRFNNAVFNPHLAVDTSNQAGSCGEDNEVYEGDIVSKPSAAKDDKAKDYYDDDSGSGIYADPDDFCHSPDYMDMSHDPIQRAGKEDPNTAEYCPAGPAQDYENTEECSTPVNNHYSDLPGAQTLERHSKTQEDVYEQPNAEYENNPLYGSGDRI